MVYNRVMSLCFALAFFFCAVARASHTIPRSIYVEGGKFHVQGVVYDSIRHHFYFSFTTRLVKTDEQGKVLGTVDNIQGHLGDLAFNPKDGTVYASLECKDDEIGSSIVRKLKAGSTAAESHKFYVAVFDGNKINRPDMDASADGVMKAAYIAEASHDYQAAAPLGATAVAHRYGCSGIDGVTVAPQPGSRGGKPCLVVAYGIYGDTLRTDNDCQVLLCYSLEDVERTAHAVRWDSLHTSGPRHLQHKLFVRTGNTRYGVQNLAYDPFTHLCFMAVYKGQKREFPNYPLFAARWTAKPHRAMLPSGYNATKKVEMLPLADAGLRDEATGVRGWNFPYGSTGFFPLGGGLYYISHNGRTPEGKQYCRLQLYRWTGDAVQPFELCTPLSGNSR